MGKPLTYGDDITISVTPANKRQLKSWARKDGRTVPELLAEMIAFEGRRRSGQVTVLGGR